jgi:hypothetical protein
MRSHRPHRALILWFGLIFGCSAPAATPPGDGSASPVTQTQAQPQGSAAPSNAAPSTAVPSSAAAIAGAGDAGSPDAAGGSSGATPEGSSAPAGSAPPAAEEPIPKVKVSNIGMHIGGGKNDASEKDPIRKSVEPHFDTFRRCFAKAEDPKKTGDVSVDLRVDKAGGKAKLTKLKTALKGKDFEDCVRATFEAIDFRKPKDGTTNVSYSLRFTPEGN